MRSFLFFWCFLLSYDQIGMIGVDAADAEITYCNPLSSITQYCPNGEVCNEVTLSCISEDACECPFPLEVDKGSAFLYGFLFGGLGVFLFMVIMFTILTWQLKQIELNMLEKLERAKRSVELAKMTQPPGFNPQVTRPSAPPPPPSSHAYNLGNFEDIRESSSGDEQSDLKGGNYGGERQYIGVTNENRLDLPSNSTTDETRMDTSGRSSMRPSQGLPGEWSQQRSKQYTLDEGFRGVVAVGAPISPGSGTYRSGSLPSKSGYSPYGSRHPSVHKGYHRTKNTLTDEGNM